MFRPIFLVTVLSAAVIAPLTAAQAGTVTITGSQSNTNAPGLAGGRCPAFTVSIANSAPFFSTGSSNLGAFTTTQSHCLDAPPPLAVGSAATPYYAGLFTYTFGNGSTLTGDYTGLLTNGGVAGLVNNTQSFNITGGSGVFAGATGGFSGSGTITFAPGAPPLSVLAFSGSVTAPGVPEPASWATMVLGFGGVGALLRRRRRIAFA